MFGLNALIIFSGFPTIDQTSLDFDLLDVNVACYINPSDFCKQDYPKSQSTRLGGDGDGDDGDVGVIGDVGGDVGVIGDGGLVDVIGRWQGVALPNGGQ